MKLTGPCRPLLWAALTLGAAGVLHASSVVGDMMAFAADTRNYNLVALGNVSLTGSSDINGAVAINGSLTVGTGAWTFASHNGTGTSDPSLYVNGQLSLGGLSQLQTGTMSAPNATGYSWDSTSRVFYSGSESDGIHMEPTGDTTSPHTNAVPAGWNWTTEASSLKSISTDLAGAASTGTATVDGGGNLDLSTAQTSGVAVFSIDASQFGSGGTYAGLKNIQVTVPSGMEYVINVLNLSNNQDFLSGINFNSGTNDDELLWNFAQTTNVTIQLGGNFYGSILAPNVNITDNTTIDGTVVANNFTDNGVELHDLDSFVSIVVPEPRTFALWAAGLCVGVVLLGRRLRRPARRAV